MTTPRAPKNHIVKTASDVMRLAIKGPGGLFLYAHGFGEPDWPGMQTCIDRGWIVYVGPGQGNEGREVSWYKVTDKGAEQVKNL
jgi:hypothetical protein